MLKEQNIRCSVIGLAASVHVCQRLCRDTQGTLLHCVFIWSYHYFYVIISSCLRLWIVKTLQGRPGGGLVDLL